MHGGNLLMELGEGGKVCVGEGGGRAPHLFRIGSVQNKHDQHYQLVPFTNYAATKGIPLLKARLENTMFISFSKVDLFLIVRFCFRPFSAVQIVKRAKSKLGEKGYNLIYNNCEHFVTWSRYGYERSEQVGLN
jgi:hypothetical protein